MLNKCPEGEGAEVDRAIMGRHKLKILKSTKKLEHEIRKRRKNEQERVFHIANWSRKLSTEHYDVWNHLEDLFLLTDRISSA